MFVMISIIVVVLFTLIILKAICIVPDNYSYVIERKGQFYQIYERGTHFVNPLLDKIVCKCYLNDMQTDICKQPIITNDNQVVNIDGYVTFKITNVQLYAYAVENVNIALSTLTATTIRNIFCDYSQYDVINNTNQLSDKILNIVQEASKSWGINILNITYTIDM